jgi:hypothetical protein
MGTSFSTLHPFAVHETIHSNVWPRINRTDDYKMVEKEPYCDVEIETIIVIYEISMPK